MRKFSWQRGIVGSVAANCIIIAQFPIENNSEQGQFAEMLLKTVVKSATFGRSLCNSQS
eukprot:COSAG06_NODE_1983_length_7920_cov_4.287303_9_plen_59_part_00